jgi:hypothetical protein
VSIQGAGALCLPEVPIALMRTYMVSCSAVDVATTYESAEAFWQSGWTAVEWFGDRAMLERAIHAVDTIAFLQQVIEQQWALARAAKPGLCRYYAPQVLPEEREYYHSGAPALNVVGYADAEATVELACALKPPSHVQGWEIFDLHNLLQVGALPDGRPVQGIRVVFLHKDTAVTERRPLLDIGARIFYYDTDGHLQEQ